MSATQCISVHSEKLDPEISPFKKKSTETIGSISLLTNEVNINFCNCLLYWSWIPLILVDLLFSITVIFSVIK